MLFHVTITHSDADCPGRHSGEVPGLSGTADHAELEVKQHSLVWGAACMVWGEPQHVAYAVLEAADLQEAVDIANKVSFGLSASLCTRDLNGALGYVEKIEAGLVRVNGSVTSGKFCEPAGESSASVGAWNASV